MKTKNIIKAFTLIELLVTMTVIGMLSSISVATLNGYTERAKVSVIKKTVSDLYRFTVLYAREEDKYYSEISVDKITQKFGIKEPEFTEIAYVASDTDFLYEASLPDGTTWTVGFIPKTYALTTVADRDGDKVTDDVDLCPDKPIKETIKYTTYDSVEMLQAEAPKRGCPYVTYKVKNDRDADGVTDDKDQCPNEPAVETIVYLIPNTKPPLFLEKKPGCPYNTYVYETPPIIAEEESEYYATGTKKAMNYFNSLDNETRRNFVKATYDVETANTLMAAAVNATFKYKVISSPWAKEVADADLDSIPDYRDQCPDVAGVARKNGCPLVDTDGDGVWDIDDNCPNVAGDRYFFGCPLPDKDKDGVWDREDQCPEKAGLEKNKGCPDTDNDGIIDLKDKCPEKAGIAEFEGCPNPDDLDGDGIRNKEDECPEEAGLEKNNGCPVKK